MQITIVDYGLGNLRSLAGAFEKIGFSPLISSNRCDLESASHLVLPGVGAFGDGMNNLRSQGMDLILNELVLENHIPFLGICLGAQLIAMESFEFGHHEGLGWLNASVKKFDQDRLGLPVPHVGWNDLHQLRKSRLFEEIPEDALFYYVHSYYLECRAEEQIIGNCDYGAPFAAAFEKGNIFATQFHPEKSQRHGLRLLKNFVELCSANV